MQIAFLDYITGGQFRPRAAERGHGTPFLSPKEGLANLDAIALGCVGIPPTAKQRGQKGGFYGSGKWEKGDWG